FDVEGAHRTRVQGRRGCSAGVRDRQRTSQRGPKGLICSRDHRADQSARTNLDGSGRGREKGGISGSLAGRSRLLSRARRGRVVAGNGARNAEDVVEAEFTEVDDDRKNKKTAWRRRGVSHAISIAIRTPGAETLGVHIF